MFTYWIRIYVHTTTPQLFVKMPLWNFFSLVWLPILQKQNHLVFICSFAGNFEKERSEFVAKMGSCFSFRLKIESSRLDGECFYHIFMILIVTVTVSLLPKKCETWKLDLFYMFLEKKNSIFMDLFVLSSNYSKTHISLFYSPHPIIIVHLFFFGRT